MAKDCDDDDEAEERRTAERGRATAVTVTHRRVSGKVYRNELVEIGIFVQNTLFAFSG